jgi:two-component system, NarL family, sensor histidine kinase ComP
MGGESLEHSSQINWEFKTITEHTLDILVIVDEHQIVKFVTPSFEAILGYSPDEFVGKNAFDLLFPEDRERLMASHKEAVLTKQPKVDEYRVVHKNGEIKYFESRVMPVTEHPDNLVVVSIRDITIRKDMEAELENRKNSYQRLQNRLKEYSQDLMRVMKVSDLKNRMTSEIVTVLPEAEPFMSIYQTMDVGLPTFFSKLTVGKLFDWKEQIHILIGERKDSAYVLTLQSSSIKESMDRIWLETMVYYTVMVFESLNVIENLMNQLEKALQKTERPQWILRLLFNLSEKQRMELSSDLHDTVLQEQMILYRKLEAILNNYQFENEVDQELKKIIQGLLDTIHQIRMTCNELRPPLLRELGLIRSLGDLFEYTQVSSTFNIKFTTEKTERLVLNEEETIFIYRIVQELLNNAAKHSEAANLTFHISRIDEKINLHYSDDGVGFAAENFTPTFNSIGLSGMRERIRSLSGWFEFTSQPGNGLKVNMQIPISV